MSNPESAPAVTLTGTISHILSTGFGGGSIFLIEPLDGRHGARVKIKADYTVLSDSPSLGEVWRIVGRLDRNKSYGDQIIVGEATRTMPSGRLVVGFLANNPRFAGIGETTARTLWAQFGEELFDILDSGDTQRLRRETTIPAPTIANLIEVWAQYSKETPVLQFFQALQFPANLARRAMTFWGATTQSVVLDDPYRLLAFAPWKTVDRVALTLLKHPPKSALRQAAAVESALYTAYDGQHTAMRTQDLRQMVRRLIPIANADEAIGLAIADGRAVQIEWEGEPRIQSAGAWALEKAIADRLGEIIRGEAHQGSLFETKFDEAALADYEARLSFSLEKEQRSAIKMVLENPFGIVLGGAGVGKTTVLRSIYEMLPSTAVIYQCALTNRAATRMRESTGREATSIARLLKLAIDDKLPSNLFLFIDEASMLDAPTFYRILKQLPAGSRLYLLGDHHQLPPIGPGLILHLMAQYEGPIVTKLLKVHRQASETGIPRVAASIRDRTVPDLPAFVTQKHGGTGVSFLRATEQNLASEVLRAYRELATLGDVQIVAARRAVCDSINETLHSEHLEGLRQGGHSTAVIEGYSRAIAVGEKVIYLDANDHQRGLFNGSIGTLTAIYGTPVVEESDEGTAVRYVAEADFDTCGSIRLTEDDMQHLALGHAITVHKAQGSQWPRVVVASEYVKATNRIVDNAWFYTALTRCEKQAVVVGSHVTFCEQVGSMPRSFERCVGLSLSSIGLAAGGASHG